MWHSASCANASPSKESRNDLLPPLRTVQPDLQSVVGAKAPGRRYQTILRPPHLPCLHTLDLGVIQPLKRTKSRSTAANEFVHLPASLPKANWKIGVGAIGEARSATRW
eukprot:4037822-Pyramimonas_sp.AAC.2